MQSLTRPENEFVTCRSRWISYFSKHNQMNRAYQQFAPRLFKKTEMLCFSQSSTSNLQLLMGRSDDHFINIYITRLLNRVSNRPGDRISIDRNRGKLAHSRRRILMDDGAS